MYSPVKAHIQELLTRNLKEWVHDFDDTSLSIGLWNGNIELSNLVLKRKLWEIGGGLCASLELARIDSIKVIVPWTRLATGNIEIEIDGFHAALRVHNIEEEEGEGGGWHQSGAAASASSECADGRAGIIRDELDLLRNANDTASHAHIKQKLDAEDLKILGVDSDHSSWSSKIVQSLSSSLLSRIAAGFTMRATNFKISVLLPLSQTKYTHVRAFLTSADTEQVAEVDVTGKSSSTHFLAKSLNIRGLAIAIDSNLYPAQVSYEELLQRPVADMVINPLNIFTKISGRKEEDSTAGSEAMQPVIVVQLETSNLEISPFFGQLTAINELTKFISSSRLRFRLKRLRGKFSPALFGGSGSESGPGEAFTSAPAVGPAVPSDERSLLLREMWAYAINGIILLVRGNGSKSGRLALRRRYIDLYLLQIAAKVSYYMKSRTQKRSRAQKASQEGSLLSERDSHTLDDLCGYFSLEEMVLFRYTALCSLRRRGEDMARVRAALLYFGDGGGAHWASGHVTPTLSAPQDGIDAEIMRVLSPPTKDKPLYRSIAWIVELSASRMALIIRESALRVSSLTTKAVLGNVPAPKVLTLALYGVNANYEVTNEVDKVLVARVGSIRLHSGTNVDLVACGADPDSWLNSRAGEEAERAVELRVTVNPPQRSGRDGSRALRPLTADRRAQGVSSSIYDGTKRHITTELTVANVKAHWDDDSILYILTFRNSFFTGECLSFDRRPQSSAAKSSMHLLIKGIELAIPCYKRSSSSGPSSGSPADSTFIFDIGKLTLAGGSFLEPPAPRTGGDADLNPNHGDDEVKYCSIVNNRRQVFYLDDDGYPSRSSDDPDGSSLLGNNNWNVRTHEQLQDIIFGSKTSSEPFLFHVMNCTLAMVPHYSTQHESGKRTEIIGENLLLVPWNIGGAVFLSTGEAGSGTTPELTVDVFFSSLSFALSLQNILDIINVGDFFYSTFVDGTKEASPPIRLAALSPIPKLKVSAKFDHLFLAILSENTMEQDISVHLETFGLLVRQRGYECPSVKAQRRLVINRLSNCLGVDYGRLDEVFRSLAEAALDPAVVLKDAVAAAEQNLRSRQFVLPNSINTHSILQIHFKRVYLSALCLSYDYRVSVKAYEVSFIDMLQRPMLMIINKKIASKEARWEESQAHRKHRLKKELKREAARKKENDLSSLDSSRAAKSRERLTMSQQENDLNNLTDKQLAVNLTIVDQDAVHGWGKGGVDVRDFYHKRRSLSQHASRRVRNIAYESFGVNVFLSDASIMKVFEELLPVMGSVKEHMSSLQEKKKVVAVAEHHHMDVRSAKKSSSKELSEPSPVHRARTVTHSLHGTIHAESDPLPKYRAHNLESPKAHTVVSCSLSVAELSVVLGRGDELLSQTQLRGIDVKLCLNSELEESISSTVVVSDLVHCDLSATSKLYSTVAWKERGAVSSVLVLNMTQKHASGSSLIRTYYSSDVTALRVCFVSKHVEELMTFVTEGFLVPAAEILSRSSAGGAGGLVDVSADRRDSFAQRNGLSPVGEESTQGGSDSSNSDSSSSDSSDDEATGLASSIRKRAGTALTRGVLWGSVKAGVRSAINLSHIVKGVASARHPATPPGKVSMEQEVLQNVVLWRVELKHITVYLPRNSHSTDVVGLCLTCVSIDRSWLEDSWPRLDSPRTAQPGHTLYFDPVANIWNDHYSAEVDRSPLLPGTPRAALSTRDRLSGAGSRGSAKKASFIISPLDTRRDSQGLDEDADFFDAKSPTSLNKDPFALSAPHVGKVARVAIVLRNVNVFTSLDAPAHMGTPAHPPQSHLRLQDVTHDEPVHASGSDQRWYQATNRPFNLQVVLDSLPNGKARNLVCDTSLPSSIDINLSMAELCLLESVYFDNMFETTNNFHLKTAHAGGDPVRDHVDDESFPLYGTREYIEYVTGLHKGSEALLVLSELSVDCSMDTNFFEKAPPSLSYLSRAATSSTDLRDYYTYTRRGGAGAAEAVGGDRWAKEVLPLGLINMKGLVLSTHAGADAVQCAGTLSFFELHDKRIPTVSTHPLVLSVKAAQGPREAARTVYYPPDMLYGWNLLPSSVQQPSKEPLSFSFTNCASYNWSTTNLGIDRLNLDFKQLDIFLLFTDYFACYFLYPEYGNPAQVMLAEAVPAGADMPYTGSDFRLFATSPFVSIKSDPLSFHSQTLVLQGDKGIFYRQLQDSKGSRRIEFSAYDLAMVVFKRYCTPDRARGMRGMAGSTGGLHTLLEYFNIALNYHYDCEAFTTDLFCNIFPDHDDEDGQYRRGDGASTKGADSSAKSTSEVIPEIVRSLDMEQIHIELPDIVEPRSVFPLSTSEKIFPSSSCDVIISYDDVLFISALLTDILDLKKHEQQQGADTSQKMSSPGLSAGADAGSPVEEDNPSALFCGLSIGGVKVIVVDSVLGLHLPLFQIFLPDLTLYYERARTSKERQSERAKQAYFEKLRAQRSRTSSAVYKFVGSQRYSISRLNTESTDETQDDMDNEDTLVHAYIRLSTWIDYFNNMRKCWEPFLERFESSCCYKDTPRSGVSVLLRVLSDVHFNWSTACLRAVDDLVLMVQKGRSGLRKSEAGRKGGSALLADTNSLSSKSSRLGTPDSADRLDANEEILQIPADNIRQILRDKSKRSVSRKHMIEVRIHNLPSPSLGDQIRVGFSIRNQTGQSLRYLQKLDEGSYAIQYLDDSARGLLNFLASATIVRNNHVVEESLGVQMKRLKEGGGRGSLSSVGHQVAIQISGFNWLPSVQADVLGIKYESLVPVIGRVNAVYKITDFSLRYKIHNALKLISEVVPHNGGRLLILRSVFTIRNYTRHALKLVCTTDDGMDSDIAPFVINSGESFNVPLALLYASAASTEGKALGCVFIRPLDLAPIEEELHGMPQYPRPGNVEYTSTPISLYDIATSNSNLDEVMLSSNVLSMGINALGTAVNAIGSAMGDKTVTASENIQLCCRVDPKSRRWLNPSINSTPDSGAAQAPREDDTGDASRKEGVRSAKPSKLPPFCYNVEVQRTGHTEAGRVLHDNLESIPRFEIAKRFFNTKGRAVGEMYTSPIDYTLVVHPPIILENLLPTGGIFELMHATHRSVIWSAYLAAGESRQIHTVTMDVPLILLINLRYCRTLDGSLIHKPLTDGGAGKGIASKIQRTFETLLDEDDRLPDDIVLTDTVGQRLRLQLDNSEGGGGQRHVVVYCPYWIVNTSQYQMRLKEEGRSDKDLPAGTVTKEKDGTRAVVLSNSYGLDKPGQGGSDPKSPAKSAARDAASLWAEGATGEDSQDQTIFCGRPGALHHSRSKELTHDSPEMRLLQELPFKDITSLAFMFNYEFHNDKGLLSNLANRKVTVQLDDSDWSPSFSMDSAGIDQSITIESPLKGVLEVGFHSKVAPGRLAKYTKVIRFMPRFVLVNNMDMALSVSQPSMFSEADSLLGGGAHQEAVSPGCLKPYHLPNIEGERNLAIKLDGPWGRSVSFKVDVSDTYNLLLRKKVDLSMIPHVHTRGDSEYLVVVPPRELGVFFETDFNEENITIKSLKNDSFAARKTDMQVGDALLAIDGIEFDGKRFVQAMELLKEKLKTTGCAVKFRTNEERMRVIRNRQLNPTGAATVKRGSIAGTAAPDEDPAGDGVKVIKVDIKTVEASVVVTISAVDKAATSEYVITNGSASHILHYKQQDISGNQWSQLVPGKSAKFVWENPFKLRRLLVRAGRNILCPRPPPQEDSENRMPVTMNELGEDLAQLSGLNPLMYLAGFAGINESNNISVNLDEIGFSERMPLPNSHEELNVAIVSEGPTKTLKVSPDEDVRDLIYSSEFMSAQIDHLESFAAKLRALKDKERENKQQSIEVRPWTISPLINLQLTNILEVLQEKQRKLMEVLERKGPGDGLGTAAVPSLSAYAPLESVLGLDVHDTHQVLVEIFEAKELAPFVTGQKENIYCKIYLKTNEKHLRAACKKVHLTYVCAQTLDPSWIDQKFLFNVPEYAQGQPRSFVLRVVVLCRGLIRNARVLGKVDIQLSCLQNEKELKGWFPVSVKNSSTRSSRIQTDAIGSIRMSCQWVHSSQGLSDYILSSVERRVGELKENLRTQYRVLKKINVTEAQKLRSNSGSSMSGKYGTTADPSSRDGVSSVKDVLSGVKVIGKRTKGILAKAKDKAKSSVHSLHQTLALPPVHLRHAQPEPRVRLPAEEADDLERYGEIAVVDHKPPASTPDGVGVRRGNVLFVDQDADAEEGFDSIEKVLLRSEASLDPDGSAAHQRLSPHPHSPRAAGSRMSLKALSATVSTLFRNYDHVISKHKAHLEKWLSRKRPIHVIRHMQRRDVMITDNATFRRRLTAESERNICHINALKGRLEIIPLQALHVSDPKSSRKPLLVRVTYGDRYEDTFSLPPAADLSWYQDLAQEGEAAAGAFGGAKDQDANSLRRYQNERLRKVFDIDKLNVKGNICVLIMIEDLPYNREIARVELPIFNILDCICTLEDGAYYDRWFPVTLSDNVFAQTEGAADSLQLQSEESNYRVFGYSPCIRLKMRWEADSSVAPVADSSKFSFRLQLPAISTAIVDSAKATELIQLSLTGVEVHHSISAKYTDSMVNITWLQIDNQVPDPLAPVVLAPSPQKFPQPVVRLNMRKNNLLSVEFLTSYDAFDLIVQELDCKIEQITVVALRDLFQAWLQEHKSKMGSADAPVSDRTEVDVFDLASENGSSSQSVDSMQTSPLSTRPTARDELGAEAPDDQQNKLYVKNFMIGPMKINVSFIMSSQVYIASGEVANRTESQRAALRDHDGLISTLSVFVWQVGDVIKDLTSTISDAPIYIYGFKGNHMFVTDVELSRRLQSHYFQYLLRQVYKIVGSLDIVGNPIGLVSSLGVGVRDFFYEPGKALIANPTELSKIGRGVFKGALSLVSNTTDGFIGTGTTFTRGLGRGMAKLSMDTSFVRSREELLRPPRNIAEALRRPYKDMSNAIYYAASGIFRVPYLTFKRNRPTTIVIGIVKGVVGVAPKIVVGGLDAVTHTGDALREIVKTFTREHAAPINRRRLGNLFGPDGRIMPYCYSTAQGTNILAMLDRVNREHAIGNAIQESSRLVIAVRNLVHMGPGSAVEDASAEGRRVSKSHRVSSSFSTLMGSSQKTLSTQRVSSSDEFDYDAKSDVSPNKRLDMITNDKLLSDIRNRSKVEFVIHTTIISNNSTVNTETIVVLSTARIVVTEYQRKNGAAVLGLLYQSMLGSLKPPSFERSGSGATLTLSTTTSSAQTTNRRSEAVTKKAKVVAQKAPGDYIIQCNDEEKLIILNNCISTVIGAFDNIIPYYKPYDTQFVEDADGCIRIGSWEYSRDQSLAEETDTSLAAFENEAVKNRINNEKWHFFNNSDNETGGVRGSERVPRWLAEYRDAAVKSHSVVAELRAFLEAHSDPVALQANSLLQSLLLQLKGGLISSEDFFAKVHDIGEVLPGEDGFDETTMLSGEADELVRRSTLGRGIGMVAGSAKSVLAFSAKTIQSAADTVSSGVSAAAAIPKLASAAATRTLSPVGLNRASSFYSKSMAGPAHTAVAERRDSDSSKDAPPPSDSSASAGIAGNRVRSSSDLSTEKALSLVQAEAADTAGIGSRVNTLMERFNLTAGVKRAVSEEGAQAALPSPPAEQQQQEFIPASPSRTGTGGMLGSPIFADSILNTSNMSGMNDSAALMLVLDRLEKLEKYIRDRDDKRS